MEITEKASWQLLTEIFGGYVLGRAFIWFYKSKFFSLLLWLSNKARFYRAFNVLSSRITDHEFFSSVIKMQNPEKIAKYVRNEKYRQYLIVVIHIVFNDFGHRLKIQINKYLKNSVKYSVKQLVAQIRKDISADSMATTTKLRVMAMDGNIDKQFVNKYLVWSDVFYKNIELRVNDLKNCNSVPDAIVRYLFIVNDFINIYESEISGIVNAINGGIKRKIRTGRMYRYE